jgi:ribonuclease HII
VPEPLSLTLAELRARYVDQARPLPKAIETALREDTRTGAQAILEAIERRRQSSRSEGQRLRHICRHEQALWREGVAHIAGVDEAGMSPLAGPVVAAAAILPVGYRRAFIDDSKKLTAEEREELVVHIKREALAWAVGSASPEEIDRINIYHAGLLAMRRAVEALSLSSAAPELRGGASSDTAPALRGGASSDTAPALRGGALITPDYLLIDARSLRDLPIRQRGIVRGDAECISIAAASIIAKTTRDAWMLQLDREYPGYGFGQHKGYGVKQHLRAIAALGVLPIHRRSFTPVREALGLVPPAG